MEEKRQEKMEDLEVERDAEDRQPKKRQGQIYWYFKQAKVGIQ